MENWAAMATASSNSRRGRLGESAMTARDFGPSVSRATQASKTESTPPEYATRQEPKERRRFCSCSSLFTGTPQHAIGRGESRVCGAARLLHFFFRLSESGLEEK